MTGWTVGGVVAQGLLAATFTVSAMAKARPGGGLTDTLVALGLPLMPARVGSIGVTLVELLTGTSLALLPAEVWPRLLCALMALTFAAAGLYALATRRVVACNCFGTGGGERLGWRQVALLPVWLAVCLLAQVGEPSWPVTSGLIGLVTLLLAFGAARVLRSLGLWGALRDDRVATH